MSRGEPVEEGLGFAASQPPSSIRGGEHRLPPICGEEGRDHPSQSIVEAIAERKLTRSREETRERKSSQFAEAAFSVDFSIGLFVAFSAETVAFSSSSLATVVIRMDAVASEFYASDKKYDLNFKER
ncbi:hypothetical protein RIF29_25666 [Crotalaria pallida]|uniref:Uncharacterized protein n=1 Tax=Crotalaria pallida TaxID=3830 RepID=A0AAN9ELX2_CROPI